ncbi:Kae1-associated serine/threonine protein kinase [Candidatus Woesearchaeota archaeon]|nr:Kae1-associated serine/threonine protein kinase [Candidatus Woesearchaeota archaeon]
MTTASKRTEIGRGAEAIIYSTNKGILKIRPVKTYRIPEIDVSLRKHRTKLEATMIQKSRPMSPEILKTDFKKHEILMEEIKGPLVKEVLDSKPEIAEQIGKIIAELHDKNIIHGDLTTSNMIIDVSKKEKPVRMIDFGLSFVSSKVEDKAVDLHLFRQAIESKHARIFEKAWNHFLQGYKPANKKAVFERFKAVESRGRHKKK